MIASGDIYARLEQLDEFVRSANFEPFYEGLLDVGVDATKELRDKQFKIDALVINSEFNDLKRRKRSGTETSTDLAIMHRQCVVRGLQLREDIEERYTRMFGGPENGH